MDHGLAVKAQVPGGLQIRLEPLQIVDIAEYRVLGGDPRQTAGLQHPHTGVENLPARLAAAGAHAGGVVLRPQGQGGDPRAGGGNLPGVGHPQGGLDVAPELRASPGKAGGGLDLIQPLLDPPHLCRALHLGQADGVRPGPDRRLQVLLQLGGVEAVDPDEHVFSRRPVVAHRPVDQQPGRVLVPGRHGVLQVVHHAVRRAEAGLQDLGGAAAPHIQAAAPESCRAHFPPSSLVQS